MSRENLKAENLTTDIHHEATIRAALPQREYPRLATSRDIIGDEKFNELLARDKEERLRASRARVADAYRDGGRFPEEDYI